MTLGRTEGGVKMSADHGNLETRLVKEPVTFTGIVISSPYRAHRIRHTLG